MPSPYDALVADDGPLGNPFEGMPLFGDIARMLGQQGGAAWDGARQLAVSVATEGTSEPNVDPVERMRIEQLAAGRRPAGGRRHRPVHLGRRAGRVGAAGEPHPVGDGQPRGLPAARRAPGRGPRPARTCPTTTSSTTSRPARRHVQRDAPDVPADGAGDDRRVDGRPPRPAHLRPVRPARSPARSPARRPTSCCSWCPNLDAFARRVEPGARRPAAVDLRARGRRPTPCSASPTCGPGSTTSSRATCRASATTRPRSRTASARSTWPTRRRSPTCRRRSARPR